MKVIVIGTNHAGTTAVRTLKRLNPKTEVVTYDKNDKISFLSCGIALWVKGEVKDPQGLFYASPEILEKEDIQVKMNHEWIGIDAKRKIIRVCDLTTGKILEDNYDKLIIATGSWPIIPPIPGINLEGVQICKNYYHGEKIAAANQNPEIKNVTIVGGGYIGVELADAFISRGKTVNLVDMMPHLMANYYDPEFTTPLEIDLLPKQGVNLKLNQKVTRFIEKDGRCVGVETNHETFETDYVIFSVGVAAQTQLLEGVVDLMPNKVIKTNEYMQSSDPNIYAIGDCATVINQATNQMVPIQLATTAVRTGIVAATNIINNNQLTAPGFTGANAIDVFGVKMASCGISETQAQKLKIPYETIVFTDADRPEFMSTFEEATLKIVWEKNTRRIIGAQISSKNNHTEIMYLFALAIQKKLKIDELPLIDIFFLPHINKPYNLITLASLEVLGLNYFKKPSTNLNTEQLSSETGL